MTIFLWYRIEEAHEDTEVLLEKTLLKKEDLPLILSKLSILLTSIATMRGKGAIWTVEEVKAEERNCLFPKSLLGATIQDGGIRERRDAYL